MALEMMGNAARLSREPSGEKLSGQWSKFDSLGKNFRLSANSKGQVRENLKAANNEQTNSKVIPEQEIKPTWRRYIILLLFCLNSGNKSFHWIQIVSLTTAATEYYQVSNYVINTTSVVFLLSFIVLSWPACLMIERMGLRRAILLASFGTAVGCLIKCFSCEQQHQAETEQADGQQHQTSRLGITLLLVGQTLVSLGEQLVYAIPTRLASVWFPDKEVSSSVAMTYFGNQLGVALGFILPNHMMRFAVTRKQMGAVFQELFFWSLVYSASLFVACYLLFNEEPEFAPRKARWHQRELERSARTRGQIEEVSLWQLVCDLFKQITSMLKDANLLLLSLNYSLILGFNNAFVTLLDQMLSPTWPDERQMVVGRCGFLFVFCGALCMPLWGWTMDKTRAYKRINMLLSVGTIVSTVLFAYLLAYAKSIAGVYAAAILVGVFSCGVMATGLEYAIELTYPAPELVTSSVMNVTPQISGTVVIFAGSYLIDKHGALECNIFYLVLLNAGLVALAMTRERLRRQETAMQLEAGKPVGWEV